MSTIQPYSARHTTEDLGDRLRISIPSRKQWLVILFISFWLVFWVGAEFGVLGSLFAGQGFAGSGSFMLVWLGGWTLGGAFVIFILCWQLFGWEVIEISSLGILTRRLLFGFGLPDNEYSSQYIKALRVSSGLSPSDLLGWSRAGRMYGLTGGLLAFDYGSKTINFGIAIDEAEAKQILAEITQRFPAYRGKESQE